MRTNTSSVDVQPLRSAASRARQRGSAVVEFAVAFLVLMGLFFGIVDFCRAMNAYEFVTFAARQGARWAIVRGSACATTATPPGPNPAAWCEPAGSASTGATAADVQTYVQSLHPLGIAQHLTVTTTWPATGTGCPALAPNSSGYPLNSPGCPVQVTVQYNYAFGLTSLFRKTIALNAHSEMVISE